MVPSGEMPEETKEAAVEEQSPRLAEVAPHEEPPTGEAADDASDVEVTRHASIKPSVPPATTGRTSAPPTSLRAGASQLPPAPVESLEAIAAAVGRLRAEVEATTERSRKARLLNEAAEIQERGGD